MINKSIKLNNENIDYVLKINKRSKGIRLAVYPGGRVSVTTPRFVPQFIVNKFLIDKNEWLVEKMKYFSKFPPIKNKKEKREEYLICKEKALNLVNERLNHFNKFYNFNWNRISIKNQKTRWGSCSRMGNLNFNYKIVLITENQADYIIVHELCHLKEMNHSKKFWNLVSVCIPDYKEVRRSLKNNILVLG